MSLTDAYCGVCAAFVALKAGGVLELGWWAATAPLWMPLAVLGCALAFAVLFLLILSAFPVRDINDKKGKSAPW